MPGKPKLYNHRVKILKYVKVSDAWRFANVVKRNGRIVRDHVLIAGRDEHHPEGSYYIEWYEHVKRHRQAVADFATVAEAARLKAIEVEALKAGVMSRPAQPATISSTGIALAAAVDQYLAMVQAQRSHRTYISYRYTLKELLVPSYEKSSLDAGGARGHPGLHGTLLSTWTGPPDRLRQAGRRAAAFQTAREKRPDRIQ